MTKSDLNSHSPSSSKNRTLLILGTLSAFFYVAILWFSFQFHHGTGNQTRPILQVLGLFAGATVCYLWALWLVLKRQQEASPPKNDTRLLRGILLSSILFRLILLPSTPIQEIDYYRYLWDGRVLAAGISPYQFAPEQIDRWNHGKDNQEVRLYLRLKAEQSETIATIFSRVHHRPVPTVYPPAAQAIFAASALVTPAKAPLWVHVLILKTFLSVFDLGTILLLASLLHRLGLPRVWSLAYGWCPLVMKEVANSAHLDSIAVFFTVLSVRLLVEIYYQAKQREKGDGSRLSEGPEGRFTQSTPVPFSGRLSEGPGGRFTQSTPVPFFTLLQASVALTALALAVLAKSYPIILLPVVGAFLLAWLRTRIIVPAAVFAGVVVLGYMPFLVLAENASKWENKNPLIAAAVEKGEPQTFPDFGKGHQPWTGLGTFLGMWEMNDFLFMLVHENLRFPMIGTDRWFVVILGEFRVRLHTELVQQFQSLGILREGIGPAFLLTQGLMGLVLAGLTLFLALAIYREPGPLHLLQGVFLTLAWGWLLSAAPNPWYLLWCLPFMLFAGRKSWFLLPGLALLYYLRFWLEYQVWGDALAVENATATFDYGLIWVEFMPFFVFLFFESILVRHRGHSFFLSQEELGSTANDTKEKMLWKQEPGIG